MKRLIKLTATLVAISLAFAFTACDNTTSGYDGINIGTSSGNNYADSGSGGDETGEEDYIPSEPQTAPSEPQNVTARASGLRCIDVSWDACEGATSYVVYYRLSSEDSEDDSQGPGTESSYEITGTYITIEYLFEDKTYDFWVIAKNSIGESGRSDVVSARQYFPAPTNVKVNVTGTGYAHVSCNSVRGATGYEVYAQRDDYGFSSEKVFLKSSTSYYITVGGLASGGHYYFYVKAVTGTKTSDFSSRSSRVLIH